MLSVGVQPNANTMAQLVTALVNAQLWDDALAMLAAMSRWVHFKSMHTEIRVSQSMNVSIKCRLRCTVELR